MTTRITAAKETRENSVIHINGAVRADRSVAVIRRRCENGKGNIGHYNR